MAEGMTHEAVAAAAGMSVRTARKWQKGALPRDTKQERHWRTRKDPFGSVWDSHVVPLLVADEHGVLDAKTVLDELRLRCGDMYGSAQLRTLQRRMHDWRRLHGPDKEVFFEQVPVAGRDGAFDFTDATELGVTIAGQVFAHLLFEFVLAFRERYLELAPAYWAHTRARLDPAELEFELGTITVPPLAPHTTEQSAAS